MTKLAQLKHPDPMHLEAAAGWIQLGDYDSANDELEKIRAEWRAHPDVLDLRWLIYSNDEQWDACLDIASAIVKMVPDRAQGWLDKAFSLRRANDGGVEKAKTVLLEAAKLFPDDSMIQYNLACYCAQRDDGRPVMKSQLIAIVAAVLVDEDLKPLWEGEAAG